MDELRAYLALGLRPGASYSEVKAAYAARAKEIHPEERPEEFQELHSAFLYLTGKLKKKKVTSGGSPGRHPGAPAGTGPVPPGRESGSPDSVFDGAGEAPGGFDFEGAISNGIRRRKKEQEEAEEELRALLASPRRRERTSLFERFFENTPDEVLASRYFVTALADALDGIPLKRPVAEAIRKGCPDLTEEEDPDGKVRTRFDWCLAAAEKTGSCTRDAGFFLSWFELALCAFILLEPDKGGDLIRNWRICVYAGSILFVFAYRKLRRELSRTGSLLILLAAELLLAVLAGSFFFAEQSGDPVHDLLIDAGSAGMLSIGWVALLWLIRTAFRHIPVLAGKALAFFRRCATMGRSQKERSKHQTTEEDR